MGVIQNQGNAARRQPDIEDYIDIARRYRSWIIGPMFAGLVIATVVAFLWPDTYISTAQMRIKAPTVADKLIPSVLHSQMGERLTAMQNDILSRNSLIEIIQKPSLDLYKKERNKMPLDDVVENLMRKKIDIRQSTSTTAAGRRAVSSFTISFSYTDRYKAQMVVRELVAKFTEQNLTQQKNQLTNTTSFLDQEKKQSKERVDKLDLQIAQFKREHPGELPEQLQSNQAAISGIQMLIMNQNERLTNLQQEKILLETSLKAQRTSEIFQRSRLQQTETIAGQIPLSVRNDNLVNLDKEIARLRSDLAARQQRQGANHPDVKGLAASLASMEQTRAFAAQTVEPVVVAGAPTTVTTINPAVEKAVQDLRNEIEFTTAQIANKQVQMVEVQKKIETFQNQLAGYQKRLDEAPASAQQYIALMTEYGLAKLDYEKSSRDRETAETAKNLEDHQGGEQLEQLDPPNLPETADEPNRPVWAGIGVFGGLMVGLALAFAREVKDTSLKNLKDVRAYTNLPVLSSIPLLENALLIRRKRRLVLLAWSTAILIGGVLMSASVYYKISGGGAS